MTKTLSSLESKIRIFSFISDLVLCKSSWTAQVAVAKLSQTWCCKQHLFLSYGGWGVQGQDIGRFVSWSGTFSWFPHCCFHCIRVWQREKELVLWPVLTRVLVPSWGSVLLTSSKSNYLSKDPPPNTKTSGIRISAYEFESGGHKHLVHNTD